MQTYAVVLQMPGNKADAVPCERPIIGNGLMLYDLNDDEIRVLGCLMEKKMATPAYYPLSLNALTNACNQKSNRDPVMAFDDKTVVDAINGLKAKLLADQSNLARVPKYEELFIKARNLIPAEAAIICILLVRGPQTAGEIRSRTERLFSFDSLEKVLETLENLEEMSLVARLPRQPGRKENRYTHRMGRALPDDAPDEAVGTAAELPATDIGDAALQSQIDDLKRELMELKAAFEAFKSQFD